LHPKCEPKAESTWSLSDERIKFAEDEISKNELRGSYVYLEDERDFLVAKDSVSFRPYLVMSAEF
jgi:hypothetical protein